MTNTHRMDWFCGNRLSYYNVRDEKRMIFNLESEPNPGRAPYAFSNNGKVTFSEVNQKRVEIWNMWIEDRSANQLSTSRIETDRNLSKGYNYNWFHEMCSELDTVWKIKIFFCRFYVKSIKSWLLCYIWRQHKILNEFFMALKCMYYLK